MTCCSTPSPQPSPPKRGRASFFPADGSTPVNANGIDLGGLAKVNFNLAEFAVMVPARAAAMSGDFPGGVARCDKCARAAAEFLLDTNGIFCRFCAVEVGR